MAGFAIVLEGAALQLGLDRAVTLGCAAIIAAGCILAFAAAGAGPLARGGIDT